MKNFKFVWMLLFLQFLALTSKNQNVISFSYHKSDPDSNIVSFVDTSSNTVLKSFSLVEHSPYWNLPFPQLDNYGETKAKLLDLSGKSNYNDYLPGLFFYDQNRKHDVKTGYTYSTIIISPSNNYVLIPHYMFINSTSYTIGYAAVVNVYDDGGKLYYSICSSDAEIELPVITDDGGHLAYTFGMPISDHGLVWSKSGYRIIDINTGRLVVNEEIEHHDGIGLESDGNFISTIYTSLEDNSDYVIVFYDFIKNTKYSTTIDKATFDSMQKVTGEGVVLKLKDNSEQSTHFLSFSTDFKREPIE